MPRNAGVVDNPFTPAADTEPWIKALLYGPPGSGKTWLPLQASKDIGKVVVFDTESGTTFYSRTFEFGVKHSKSFSDLVSAVDFVEKNPDACKVFVIDPITVIYEVLQEAAHRARVVKAQRKAERERRLAEFDPENVDLEMLDWGRIKRDYKALMNRLMALRAHVIVTARQKDITEKRGQDMVKVGVGPDAEKGTAYYFDVVLRAEIAGQNRVFTVEKARGMIGDSLPLGSRYTDPTFASLFGAILNGDTKKATAARPVASDDAAAQQDAKAFGEEVAGPALAAEFAEALGAAGYDPEEVRVNRGWLPFADMPKATIDEALAKVRNLAAQPPAAEAPAPAATTNTEAAPEAAGAAA